MIIEITVTSDDRGAINDIHRELRTSEIQHVIISYPFQEHDDTRYWSVAARLEERDIEEIERFFRVWGQLIRSQQSGTRPSHADQERSERKRWSSVDGEEYL